MSGTSALPEATRRQRELDFLQRLPHAKYDQLRPTGVLLSDQIRHYINTAKLIEPFNEEGLKAASYELRVGILCSVGGRSRLLEDVVPHNELTIAPFEVAVIQTLERVNLPHFLVARWNIRVRWAYEGLMWVGGPQVDPGYQGYLFCPIYNLSDKPVTLRLGDPIAQIDFATTTPIGQEKPYPDPSKRTRLLFVDYNVRIKSALATLAHEKIGLFEKQLADFQSRNDLSNTVIFTALAVIVGAVTVVADKANSVPWSLGTWISIVAVFLSLTSLFYGAIRSTASADLELSSRGKFSPRLYKAVGIILVSCLILPTIVATVIVGREDVKLQELQRKVTTLEKVHQVAVGSTVKRGARPINSVLNRRSVEKRSHK